MNKPLTERESKVADIFLYFLSTLEKGSAFKSIVNTFFKKHKVNKERALLICKLLEKKSLVTLMLDSNENLRNLNFDIYKIKEFLKNEQINKIWITENKLFNDSKLSKWQVITFWWIFVFASIGTGLSIYNFRDSLSISKNVIKQEERIVKMELELSKLRTLILIQKKDSLLVPTSSRLNK